MIKRLLISAVLLLSGFAHADWAADRDGSAGYVTVTTLATAIDEAVPFAVVYLSDLPADFHTAMSDASDTDGKTIRVSTSDGTTQLACVPIGVNTGTDTGCLIFLGTGMSASSDVDYRIYVGNASLSMPTASGGMGEQAVFAAYAGVYFPGVDTRDWTSGGRTLTAVNTPGTGASDYEGITAATYNGTDEYHKYEGSAAVTNWPISLEVLANPANTSGYDNLINLGLASGNSRAVLTTDANRFEGSFLGASGSSSTPTTSTSYTGGTWNYGFSSRDANSGTSQARLNSGTIATNTTTITTPTAFDRTCIGAAIFNGTVSNYLNGSIAVALLSSSVRSADYMTTMQDNWAGTMYSAGAWTATATCNSGSTGWVLFQAAANDATGGDTAWSSVTNALVDDANTASATSVAAGNTTDDLELTDPNYGVTVPTTADSYTVSFRVKRARSSGSGQEIRDSAFQMIVGGAPTGDNLADTLTDWPTSAASVDYVSTYAWTGTEFNANLGISLRALSDGANPADALVSVAWIKVDWTCGDAASKARGFFALTE